MEELEKEHPDSIVIVAAWVNQRPCFRVDHCTVNTYEAVTVLVAEGPVLKEFRKSWQQKMKARNLWKQT